MYHHIGEFGNHHIGDLDSPQTQEQYQGVALTLIDSLSTLAVVGNQSEFEKGVWWIAEQVHNVMHICAATHCTEYTIRCMPMLNAACSALLSA